MAKDTQRRFLGRDQQAHERGNGGFHLFQRKETTGQTDQDRVSEDSGIKTSGLESMAEPRLEDDAETSKSTVHEAGGLERMMDDRGDEDISEEDLRLDDRFLDEEFLEDDGERNVVRRRVKKPKRTGSKEKARDARVDAANGHCIDYGGAFAAAGGYDSVAGYRRR